MPRDEYHPTALEIENAVIDGVTAQLGSAGPAAGTQLERAQAGRYLAVVTFAQKPPSGIAPPSTALVISIGAVSANTNYVALHVAGAVLALIGATRVRSVR